MYFSNWYVVVEKLGLMDSLGIHLIFERGLKGEAMLNIIWWALFNEPSDIIFNCCFFGMTQSWVEPWTSLSRTERSITEPPLQAEIVTIAECAHVLMTHRCCAAIPRPHQNPDPHVRNRIKIEQVKKLWDYSCRQYQIRKSASVNSAPEK